MENKKTGFTLIELLVVIAIIALLLAILMPALNRAKELAKRVVCGSQLKNIGIAVSGYAGKADGDMPNVLDVTGDEEIHPYVAYRGDKVEHVYPGQPIGIQGGKMIPYRLGSLWDSKLIDIAKTFYCPSNKDPEWMLKSYTDPLPPNTSDRWGTLPQKFNTTNQWVRIGYEWFPVSKDPKISELTYQSLPILESVCRRYDKVSPHLAYCADLFRQGDMFSHKYGKTMGLNLLYIDGRVVFCSDKTIFRDPLWNTPITGPPSHVYAIYYARVSLLGSQ